MFKEEVDDVGAHITSGTSDENVARRIFVRARRTPGAIDSPGTSDTLLQFSMSAFLERRFQVLQGMHSYELGCDPHRVGNF